MNRVVHFEVASDDPERAAEFYKSVFNWQINKWDGPIEYWMVSTGDQEIPGIDGGMFRKTEDFSGTVNTIAVDDIDPYLEKVTKAGGTILQGKNAIPGVGYQAYCKDPDGTIFGIHQMDENAK